MQLESSKSGGITLCTNCVKLAEVCEVVIELYYQEVWLVLDNIYMRICLAPTHVTDQGLPI